LIETTNIDATTTGAGYFFTLMTTNQQSCGSTPTPCWKIILMGSDHGKIIFNPKIIFAWFDLCQKKYMALAWN